MQCSYIAQDNPGNTDKVNPEKKPVEAKYVFTSLQRGVPKSQEDRKCGNAGRCQRAQQRSDMRNAGKSEAVRREDAGENVKPS